MKSIREAVSAKAIKSLPENKRWVFLEIGCMFNTDEGKSTLKLLEAIKENPQGGKLLSIEMDDQHIAKCIEIISSIDESLLNFIEFFHGPSLDVLEAALNSEEELDFAVIDGGADPLTCLKEFIMINQQMSEDGLILVDDIQELKKSKKYRSQRFFGKGTLIIPTLIWANYLHDLDLKNIHLDHKSLGDFVIENNFNKVHLFMKPGRQEFVIIGISHKVLLYGKNMKEIAKNFPLLKQLLFQSFFTLRAKLVRWFRLDTRKTLGDYFDNQ